MARRTIRTPKKREIFLDVLAGGGSVTLASATAGIGRQRVYEWRQDDANFATEWDVAIEAGTDVLEDEARRRAVEGVEEPVFFQGNTVGHVRRYSDTLLIFLLKGRRPTRNFKSVPAGVRTRAVPSRITWMTRSCARPIARQSAASALW